MGVTQDGNLLDWKETKKYAEHSRQEAIKQFINWYRKVKDRTAEAFVWGDEIEHILIKFDDVKKTARVLPKNTHVLPPLKRISSIESGDKHGSIWMPEYGAFQLESTPGRPFGSNFSTFNMVESNMKLRRQQVKSVLDRSKGEVCLTMTHLPRFGCPNSYVLPDGLEAGPPEITKSLFYPDVVVSPFGRYIGAETNTRGRRREHVSIDVPVFKDKHTTSPFWDPYSVHHNDETANASKVDHIHADCTVAASSCSCLQVTFQTSDVSQAKYLYDQMIPMCPIMLALGASSPVFRGFLADVDCRWNAVSASLDSRNREERGVEPLKESKFVIPKAKFDTVSYYLSAENETLNDIVAPYEEATLQKLVNGGLDIHLARHIAYILIRDPLILYEENIHQNVEDIGHFDNIFSMNWLSLRLKPPPADSEMGWRVEFRPLEVQLTDFENAAYVIFIMLLARAIDKFKLDLAIPISKVDANMEEAHAIDAVSKKMFFFKEDVESCSGDKRAHTEMSIDVIINGGVTSSGTVFPGLIPIIKKYINTEKDADDATRATVSRYLQLISDRAAGRVNTIAKWTRNFVEKHPDYKNDSVISERINYDLVKLFSNISDGTIDPQHLNSSQTSNI